MEVEEADPVARRRETSEPGCASTGVMVREIGLGVLLTLFVGLTLWALSSSPGGRGPVPGILGTPVVVAPADGELGSTPKPGPVPSAVP